MCELHHTQKCLDTTAVIQAARALYTVNYPDHCKTCEGAGTGFEGGDSVDYGSTRVSLPTYDVPCPDCLQEGRCPRCNQLMYDSEDEIYWNEALENQTPCIHCNWNWGKTAGDAMLKHDECDCFTWIEMPYSDGVTYG